MQIQVAAEALAPGDWAMHGMAATRERGVSATAESCRAKGRAKGLAIPDGVAGGGGLRGMVWSRTHACLIQQRKMAGPACSRWHNRRQ